MAIVTGTFPYKEQLEQFRVAMRKRNLSELMSLVESQEAKFEFAGFDIERRVLKLDGKLVKDWVKYDTQMLNALKYYFARAVEIAACHRERNPFPIG